MQPGTDTDYKTISHFFSPHTSRPTHILTLTCCSCFLPEEVQVSKSTSADSQRHIHLHTLSPSLSPGKNYLLLPKATTPLLTSPHSLSTMEKPCSSSFSSPLDHFLCMYTVMFYVNKYAHTVVISSISKTSFPRFSGLFLVHFFVLTPSSIAFALTTPPKLLIQITNNHTTKFRGQFVVLFLLQQHFTQ